MGVEKGCSGRLLDSGMEMAKRIAPQLQPPFTVRASDGSGMVAGINMNRGLMVVLSTAVVLMAVLIVGRVGEMRKLKVWGSDCDCGAGISSV